MRTTAWVFAVADRELVRRVWQLTWPLLLYNLLDLIVTLVELYFVRPHGQAATAAVSVSRQVIFLVESAALSVSTGVLTLVSQGVGARSVAGTRAAVGPDAVVRQAFILLLLLGPPAAAAGFALSRPLLLALAVSGATLDLAGPYLHVYFAGLLFTWANLIGNAIFRGAGDAWTPLKLAVGVNVLNALLSYGFIVGLGSWPGFGVSGGAAATVAARAGGAVMFLVLLLRGAGPVRLRLAPFRPDRVVIARTLRIGMPMALTNVLRHGSRVVFLAVIGGSAIGESLQAAVGLGMQVRQAGILPALAFQTALAALVGQAIGRGDLREAEALGRRGVQLLAVLLAVPTVGVLVLAGSLAAAFLEPAATARLGARVLLWFAPAVFFSALSIGIQGALIGAGDTRPALRYVLVSEWGLMLPFAYLVVRLEWLPNGLLAAWAVAPLLTFALMQRYWRGGRWRRKLGGS